MRISKSNILIGAVLALSWSPRAAIFEESGGVVVIEAEHFDSRTTDTGDNKHWHIVLDEDFVDEFGDFGDPLFLNARGDTYIQSLPEANQNQSSPDDVGSDPYVDYKVSISTLGTYQLYLRWGGWDGGSDSIYGEIVELRDGPGGTVNDWYRYARQIGTDFATSWHGVGGPELNDAGGSDVAATWDIPSAGTYTIRLSQREDGSAVDALIFQLSSLPAPSDPGPPESGIATTFITFTEQPSDARIASGQTATFTVAATGSSATSIQWQMAAPGSSEFADIAGATSASYTTPALTAANDGTQYRAKVSITDLTLESRAATAIVDVVSPIVYGAVGSATFNKVTVAFSEPVDPASAETAGNYSVAGLTVSEVSLDESGTKVELTTSAQTSGQVYDVMVKDIKDRVSPANTLDPNPSTTKFTAWVLQPGGVLHEYYAGVTQNNIDGLRNNPDFPDNPTFTTIEPAFEYPPDGANEGGSNYGNRLSGLLTPPVTGQYIFFVNSDDPSELYLSSDDDPANKLLIAQETAWSNAREWISSGGGSDLDAKRSDFFFGSQWPTLDITLQAGKSYYMEALHTEGGGGDNVAVTWIMPGGSEPSAGDPPIPGEFFSTFQNPDNTAPEITEVSVASSSLGGTAVLSVEATGAQPFGYQWRFKGADIPGATEKTLRVSNLGVDNIGPFYVVEVSNFDSSVTAPAAVFPDGALLIEAEDFNFDGGNYIKDKPIGMDGLYPGGDYRDRGSFADDGIDWNNPGGNADQPYRPDTGVAAGKPNQHPDGIPRGDFDVEVNHVVGWNDAGDWQNYTRVFPEPARDYNVIGRLSSGGNPIHSQLDEVTAGADSFNQTLVKLGEFNPGRATANWDTMEFFPLLDDSGNLAAVNLGGERTIRWTALPDANQDLDYIMFVPLGGGGGGEITGVSLDGGSIRIEFTGTLESADEVTGPWTSVPNASSPVSIPISGTQKFYRVRP